MTEGAACTSRVDRDTHETTRDAIQKRYTLLTEIAQGEVTVVHMARPHSGGPSDARPVTLKWLKPEFAFRPECVQLLRHEAWVSSRLHHSALTRCLEVVETADSCCIVQNYVEGENLANLLQAADRHSHARYVVPLLLDVLEGLQAVHTALDEQSWPLLLLHGAVRPQHVLVGIDGSARLTDFSHAKSRRGLLSGQVGGQRMQARNMAPEQVLDPETADHRADLFLVGVMLWEALTGTALFAAENEQLTLQHLQRRPILPPSKTGLRPSPCLDEVCMRALARDPNRRYESALEMACALRDAASKADLCANRAEIGQWVQCLAGANLAEQQHAADSAGGEEPFTDVLLPDAEPSSNIRSVAHASASESDPENEPDDEPTARFARCTQSDMREIARIPSSASNAADEEGVTSEFPERQGFNQGRASRSRRTLSGERR